MTVATAPLLRIDEREGEVLAIVLDRPDQKVNLIDEDWLHEMTGAIDRVERGAPPRNRPSPPRSRETSSPAPTCR